jgi:hypothetical protein
MTRLFVTLTILLAGLTPANRPGAQRATGTEIVIEGTLTAADRLAWIDRAFDVPAGTGRIDVETSFTGKDQGTALEFGVYDPVRFRGASRFSKDRFFISRTAASASYHPGELQPGEWRILIGVPSIRDGVTSTYRITIRVTPEGPPLAEPAVLPATSTTAGPGWYQGDLHTHTMHSDGFGCADGRGGLGPCAVHQVVDAAARRGLDFIAVTDHNTTSHHNDLAILQLQHPRMLLLRGQEVTTFYGHANVYGTGEVVDFRIGHPGVTANTMFAQARRLGALLSINHPARETGETCTGCGWNAANTDWSQLESMEVVNAFTSSGPTAGEPFWHARLNEGHRITGVGGSDDHAASTRAGTAVGTPTTVIHAESLSEQALIAGILSGRVYIKVRGPEGPDIRFTAAALNASMGDVVKAGAVKGPVQFTVDVMRGHGQRVEVIRNGGVIGGAVAAPVEGRTSTVRFTLPVAKGDWVRVNLRDASGVTVIGNPIYFR